MKKVKEWLQQKKVKQILDEASKIRLDPDALFEVVCVDEEGVITTVKSINGDYFSLGDYKIRDSEDIFTITEFHNNLRVLSFKTKAGESSVGNSMGLSLITDISLIDSDTTEYSGFLLKSQNDIKSVMTRNFSSNPDFSIVDPESIETK